MRNMIIFDVGLNKYILYLFVIIIGFWLGMMLVIDDIKRDKKEQLVKREKLRELGIFIPKGVRINI